MACDEEMSWSLSSLSEGRISLSNDGQVATYPHQRQEVPLSLCLQYLFKGSNTEQSALEQSTIFKTIFIRNSLQYLFSVYCFFCKWI